MGKKKKKTNTPLLNVCSIANSLNKWSSAFPGAFCLSSVVIHYPSTKLEPHYAVSPCYGSTSLLKIISVLFRVMLAAVKKKKLSQNAMFIWKSRLALAQGHSRHHHPIHQERTKNISKAKFLRNWGGSSRYTSPHASLVDLVIYPCLGSKKPGKCSS